jgi:hypothetical protein
MTMKPTSATTNNIILTLVLLASITGTSHGAAVGILGGGVEAEEKTIDSLLRQRGLQTLDPACKVEDFEFYEFSNNSPTASLVSYPCCSVLDMTDFGQINIAAAVTANCRPACVKLSFAGKVQKEKRAPYSLYGDTTRGFGKGAPRLSGLQELKACLYTNAACTAGEQGCKSQMVDVIPKNYPLKAGPFTFAPFSLVFDNIRGPATAAQTAAAATKICQVTQEYWNLYYYKSDISVNLKCSGSAVAGAASLTIKLSTTATVNKGTGFNPYLNLRLPTSDVFYSTMKTALDTNDELNSLDIRMIEYFVELLNDATNPYSAVTSFSIA